MSFLPIILAGLTGLALGSGQSSDAASKTTAQAGSEDVCTLAVDTLWQPAGVEPLTLTARSYCQGDRVRIERKILDADGQELFSATYPVNQVMTLVEHEYFGDPLGPYVEDWMEPGTWRTSTADLPAYHDTSEFPFMPALSPAEHEAARTAGHPLLCYVQGMESSLCLALVDGKIINMGVQRFPG